MLFNQHLNALRHIGFTRSVHDPCLYYRRDTNGLTILAVVVDDILMATSSPLAAKHFVNRMRDVYKPSDFGELLRMVGINISRNDDGSMTLDQVQFIRDLARKYGQEQANPVSNPIASGDVPEGDSPSLPPDNDYLSLIGSPLWCLVTGPDIAVAVSLVCSKAKSPTRADQKSGIRILRYLLGTPDVKLTYVSSTTGTLPVSASVDAAWANAPKARSRFGYMINIYGNPVLWVTKVSSMVCLSTVETEFVAAVHAGKATLWMARMLAEVRGCSVPCVHLLENNQACIHMTENPVVSARNQHFAMRMHWLRSHMEQSAITLTHVPSSHQLADLFTKVLPTPRFLSLRAAVLQHQPLPSVD